jgi:hypothetical protein
MKFSYLNYIAAFLLASTTSVQAQTDICQAPCEVDDKGNKTCKFTVIVDVFASRHGYMSFAECGPQTNPTIGLEKGATYIFEQTDISNYMIPINFSYAPDGGHRGGDPVASHITPPGSSSDCAKTMSCPMPMYFGKDGYLGGYSNIEELAPLEGCGDSGLSEYRLSFSNSLRDWVIGGGWQVALKLDIDEMATDFFYFNDILPFMSGRAKVLNSDGTPLQEEDLPELGFEYQIPSDFDKKCGTVSVGGNSLPKQMCPANIVCDVPEDSPVLQDFAECVEAIDCQMIQGMTNDVKHNSPVALFMHQMIPHFQAAGNMAKAILKTGLVDCPDIKDSSDPHCMLERILRATFTKFMDDVITMRKVLGGLQLPGERANRCKLQESVFFP